MNIVPCPQYTPVCFFGLFPFYRTLHQLLGNNLANVSTKWFIISWLILIGLGNSSAFAADNALSFNGSSSYVNVVDTPFQLANGTWEAWFKVNILGIRHAILAKDVSGYNDDGWLGIAADNRIYFYIDKSPGIITYGIYSNSTIISATWYHVAVTWGSGGMKMYVNGILQAQTDANTSGMVSSGNNLRIGERDSIVSYDYFNGSIDEVRVWNVARTQAEIDQYKGVTLTGSEAGLVAYYRFDEGAGTTIGDLAGTNDSGTLVNNPTWTTTTPGVVYAPTTDAASLTVSSKTTTSMTLSWINGNGASRVVLMKSGGAPDAAPALATPYTANAAFGSGSQIGTGNYVVYSGAGTTVTVTGLTAGTTYGITVYEFNGTGTTSNYTDMASVPRPVISDSTKSTQIITFTPSSTSTVNGGTGTLTLTGVTSASSGLTTFTFGSTTPSICTVSGSTVSYVAVGTCTLTADQAGDAMYDVAPQATADVTVGQASQFITFSAPTNLYAGQTESLTATADSGLTVTFGSSTPSICTVSGSTVSYIAVGTCTLTADQAGNANYSAASQVSNGVTIAQGNQTISFNTTTGTVSTSATPAIATSNLPVTLTSSTTSICTVSGATVNYIAVGTCSLTADQAGDTNYNAAPQVSGNITVGKITQMISFPAPIDLFDGQTFSQTDEMLGATASSGLTVTFDSSTPSICTISIATVSYIAAGTCTLTANQAGDATFDAATQVTRNITVTNPTPPSVPTYPLTNSTPAPGQTIQFDTLVGQKQTQSLTLKNFGSAALIFNSINTPVAPFSYPKPMPFNFIPTGDPTGSPKILEISCTPNEMGLKTMTLQIATNDPDNITLSYPLECMGRQAVALSSVANNSPLNFSTLPVNGTATQTVSFSETGNADLILNSATITGTNAADFAITSPTTFPVIIVDGATTPQVITVSCTPKTAISLSATLQITTNDPSNVTLIYPLQCSGFYTLTLSTSGQGTINGCGSNCVQNYQQDAVVNLTATPATGWQFSNWSGDCVNGQVQMSGNKTCVANFTQIVENTAGTGSTPTGTPTTPTNTTNPTGTTGGTTPSGTNSTTTPTSGTTTTGTATNPPTTTPTTSSGGGSGNAISVIATAPVTNGVADGSMSNYNQVATNLIIPANSSVSGGVIAGNTTNHGLIANVTIAPNSTVTGGKLSGFNTNFGTLNAVTVSQYSQVNGGNYGGTTTNSGTLINPIILPNGTVINAGTIENPIILPGAHVTGGKLEGIIVVLAVGGYQNTQITTNIITQVQNIPAQMFSNFNAATLSSLSREVLNQITPEQFAEIPVEALNGLTSENMGALSPEVAQSMDHEQIQALNPEEFQAMPSADVANLLTNFDIAQITLPEAGKLLPQHWAIDVYGNLTAPPGVRISLRSLAVSGLPEGLKLPNTPDLNSSFALGGRGTHPVIDQINQMSAAEGFVTNQQKTGIIHADMIGGAELGQKRQFSFMIDPDQIFMFSNSTLRGLQLNEQGQYIIVTEDGKQIPITPMAKDPEQLLSVLGNNGKVDIQKTGEVLLTYGAAQRKRDAQEVYSITMFDPFIEPAPEDICTPEGVCDWSIADASMQPGLRSARNLRAKSAAKIVYPDGTAQQLYPAVLLPDTFIEEAKKFEGVEKIIFRMDGTFAVTYQGFKLLLIPDFDTQVQPIPADQEVKASLILLSNQMLSYQVPYQGQLFTTTLTVMEALAP